MVNRKRNAAEAKLDSDQVQNEKASTSNAKPSTSRPMQGDGTDGNKHTIDSDEEEEFTMEKEKYEVLDDEEIEGQEDDTITKDGEVQITPFNLNEEREEGDFSKEGDFIWKKTKDINDAWLDNIDWVKVKEVTKTEQMRNEASDEAEEKAESAYNEVETYKSVLAMMKPGENVAKAIRRLSGATGGPSMQKVVLQKQRKIAQKLKKKQKLSDEEEGFQKMRQEMTRLTGLADSILSRSGNMEIYDETYEKISFRLKEAEKEPKRVIEDAMDMFSDNFDAKAKAPPTEDKSLSLDSEVMWEYRWEQKDDSQVHGPHSSTEMLKWQDSGFFDKGVYVRRVGSTEFLDGKRIDFDLYV